MRFFKKIIFFIALCLCITQTFAAALSDFEESTTGLIKRVLPKHASFFLVEKITQEHGKDVFEIEGKGAKIVLRGNTPVEVASALNWYLKYYCHAQRSWCGDNMDLPAILPVPTEKVHQVSPYKERVYLNYCTFNYSMSWWDWERWEREIDWMAMQGINMPLAITGQEAVWQNTLRKYGMNDDEIRSFLVGPAYFAWQWMTNIESINGPLPQNWINRSIVLGQKILKRQRAFGMTPILQGFTGYVPIKLIEKQPQADIRKKNIWFYVGPGTAQLNPLDPLYAKMSKTFIEEQTRLFGTNHIYAADPFHEGKAPVAGDEYLAAVGKAIYTTTSSVDPKAVIAMQTWSMQKAIVQSIPAERILMLDLNASKWKGSEAFWGRPWVGGIIHNFGGNTAMGGDLDAVLAAYPAILNQPEKSKQFQGIGMFPEAIEHNPIIYDAAAEMTWHREKPDTKKWMDDYLLARYGTADEKVSLAWDTLLNTVYGKSGIVTFMESSICARPALKVNGASPNGSLNTEKKYRFKSLWEAIDLLQKAPVNIKNKDTYRYDLVDLMRQCMADLAIPIQREMADAYRNGDKTAFAVSSKRYLDLMDDFDQLLGTRKEFLLGKWIADARAIGKNKAESDLYEKNARALITIWGPYDDQAIQYDYSARQWNGMVKGFYKARWIKFIDFLNAELLKDEQVRYKEENINNRYSRPSNTANDFYKMISKWEANWTEQTGDAFNSIPSGNEVATVNQLYQKWLPVANNLLR